MLSVAFHVRFLHAGWLLELEPKRYSARAFHLIYPYGREIMITTGEILWGIVGLLIGSFIGHWFALGRERRKEYNELADKLFIKVDVKVNEADAGRLRNEDTDIKLIRRRMGWFKKRMFDRAMTHYLEATGDTYPDDHGVPLLTDPTRVTATLQDIAKCLGRK